MEVRPDHAAGAATLEAAFPIVAEAGEHAAERLGAGIEARPSGMVLEPGERALLSGLELAFDQDVTDHAALSRDGLEGKEADARHVLAVEAAVAAAQQLVAAAHREHGRTTIDRFVERLGFSDEIVGDEKLLPVLPAADVVEVVVTRHDRVAHAEGGRLELMAARRRPAREHGDVAAVGVDVEVLRVEVAHADCRHTDRSQYGFASPRAASRRCTPSIAV